MTNCQHSKAVRELRVSLGLSQREAAIALGITERNYQRYETGQRNLRDWEFKGVKQALEAHADVFNHKQ